jgi:hypothetical protein
MMSLVAVGVLILSALSVVCFAAYKIRARSFEVSTSVWRIASFSIKIISADARVFGLRNAHGVVFSAGGQWQRGRADRA